MIDHGTCRRQIVEDQVTTECRHHLERCPSCSRFALAMRRVTETAPRLAAPAAPPDLPARVLERVRREASPAPRGRRDRPGARRDRPGARRVAEAAPTSPSRRAAVAIALAASLVLGLVVAPILASKPARAALLEAARETAEHRTGRIALQGTVRGNPRSGGSPAGEGFTVEVRALGEVAFTSELRLVGSSVVRGKAEHPGVADRRFALVITARTPFGREAGGLPERSGALPPGQVLRRPDTLLTALAQGAFGEVQDLGPAELGGEPVRRYRFQVPGAVLAPPFPSSTPPVWTTEAWVRQDNSTLKRLTAVARGAAQGAAGLSWGAAVRLDVFGLGAEVFRAGRQRGALTAGGISVLPLPPDRNLSPFAGQRVKGRSVRVQSVAADEGFWVGPSQRERVFVHLVARGESPLRVRAGDRVSFEGTMRRNPRRLAELGILGGEGRELLAAERYHVEVNLRHLRRG